MSLVEARKALHRFAKPKKAKGSQIFFKTGPGQYAEGDVFIGLTTGEIRGVAKTFPDLSLSELKDLLGSPIHEERSLALSILVSQFKKADTLGRKRIFQFYLGNSGQVNNWDLVDSSAPHIAGTYLLDKSRKPLHLFCGSKNLWKRRIAVVATHTFIRAGDYQDCLVFCERLLQDEHDLMHKACGWMLREIGRRHRPTLERFLKKHQRKMPRTMLRYAIEHFPENRRQAYLKGTAK